jgi:hypothetical protein
LFLSLFPDSFSLSFPFTKRPALAYYLGFDAARAVDAASGHLGKNLIMTLNKRR